MRKLKTIIIGFASMFAGTPQEIMQSGEVIHICSMEPGDIWEIRSHKSSENFRLGFDGKTPFFLARCGEPDWSFAIIDQAVGRFHQNRERHESQASASEFLREAAQKKFGESIPLSEIKKILLTNKAKEEMIGAKVPLHKAIQFREELNRKGFKVGQASLDELEAFLNEWQEAH